MTSLWLHGLVVEGAATPPDAGAHRRIAAGGLVGLCTSVGQAPDTAESAVAGALAHNALLVAQASQGAILPVRYGTAFSSEVALREHLSEHADLYRATLQRIGDAREFGLRLQSVDAQPEPAFRGAPPQQETGRAFLERGRLRRDRRGEEAQRRACRADRLARVCAGEARAMVRQARSRADTLVDLALLVSRDREDALRERARAAQIEAAKDGLCLTLSGPWPPYSFADLREAADA